jgi:hypothetical protein
MALAVVGPTTGLWLLARVHDMAGPDWLRRPEWAALGALALLGSALVAWAVADETWRVRWIAVNRASVVVLAAYVSGSSGPEALAWPLITFTLGCALLMAGQTLHEQTGRQAPVWLAVLALWGFPATPGFLARTALVFPTGLPVAVPLFAIVLLAEVLFVAALWQAAHTANAAYPDVRRSDRNTVALLAATVLLFILVLAAGVAPGLYARAAGWPTDASLPSFGAAIATARRSVWIGLIVSGILGVTLGLLRREVFGQLRGWQTAIAGIVSLEWLYQGAATLLALAASGLQYFAVLGEGEGYLGWLALAGLILWVLLRG